MQSKSVNKMSYDPMMEIFMEECLDLVAQYETYLSMAEETQVYDLNLINEVFRITHTLKADATMMLYECIAVPARAFERILYYYRDKYKQGVDYNSFTALISEMLKYIKLEIQRIIDGTSKESDGERLTNRFNSYRETLMSEVAPEHIEDVKRIEENETKEEPIRFYIGGQTAVTPTPNSEKKKKAKAVAIKCSPEKLLHGNQNGNGQQEVDSGNIDSQDMQERTERPEEEYRWVKQKNAITTEEMKELYEMITGLHHLEEKMTLRFKKRFQEVSDILMELREIDLNLLDWVTNAWMIPIGHISPKLRKTVEEMNERLGKQVDIEIIGENILIPKGWIDKLSGTLVHLLRNSIDHGIEEESVRKSEGKSPNGTICLTYSTDPESGDFELRMSDDGQGVDVDKVHEAAVKRRLICEDEEIDPEGIIQLMFAPGLSTNEEDGIYSGRGVGMDAVWHNIHDIGGEIQIENHEKQGMTVVIQIPFQDAVRIEEDTEDEDFDSRR